MIALFSRRGLLGRRWYFHVKADNNQIVASSEGYNSAEARDGGLCSVVRAVYKAAGAIGEHVEVEVKDLDRGGMTRRIHVSL